MLRMHNLSAGYAGNRVIHDLDIEVNSGEVVTIVGANGAGKTTTLRALCGLIPADTGRIEFDGKDITGVPGHRRADLGLALIPEGRQLFPFMSVKDNLLLGAYNTGARRGIESRLAEVLDLFPALDERLHQSAASLSGGEQQMVAIGRGIMAKPRLLLFDEPSLGLAPIIVRQVFEIIDTVVSAGTTVLIVEQNIFHTLSIADRGYVLENGEIVMSDSGTNLLDNPHVKQAYLGI